MHLIVLIKKTKGFQILSFSLFFFLSSIAFVYIFNLRKLKVGVLFGIHSIDVVMKKKNKRFPNSPFIFFVYFSFFFSYFLFIFHCYFVNFTLNLGKDREIPIVFPR
jgi:hypothetical protein